MLVSSHAALLVALAVADPRAYAGPEGVPVRAPAGSWPASAGPPPGQGARAPAVPGDRSAGSGDRSTGSGDRSGAAVKPAGGAASGAEATPAAEAPATSVPGGEAVGLAREVRYIEVTTSLLGRSTRLDVHRHAGGRAIVSTKKAVEQGAGSVAEMLDKVPGVRAVEGNSGLSTSSTKLNVAVRGANPRLSEQATVLLDEVPIAPAPYGNPSLSLFPLSLFQIASIDAVRGGASVRFGPWTSGGVFNLVSHPIPENPTISVTAQSDHFGDAGAAASYGGTHKKLGMYFEYAPRFGKTYREHSEFQSHGGIIKFAYPITPRLKIESNTHLFWERTNLPGGLKTSEYEVDRFQSVRPFDRFHGHREGSNLKLRWKPKPNHELQVIAFYSHSVRSSVMASNLDRNLGMPVSLLTSQPRVFDVVGLEPRYALRVDHKKMFQDISIGVRGIYEMARLREFWSELPAGGGPPARVSDDTKACPKGLSVAPELAGQRCLDGRTGGYSIYLEDKLYLLDTKLVITGGLRAEIMRQGFYDRLFERSVPQPLQGGLLPGLNVWYGGDRVAGFIGYGRSFGAPSYFSASVNMVSSRYRQPELADMVEGGIKLMELGGVYADVTGWYKYFRFLRDEGDNSLAIIPGAHAYGVEAEVEWEPGEVWERVEGLELKLGYAYTGSAVLKDIYTGNRMPWYPVHEAWGSAAYRLPFGLKFGTSAEHTGAQFTDYGNITEWATGELGTMPAYTLMTAFAGVQAPLPQGWRLEFTVGVKNLLNQVWFTRTDDLNGGILAMRPRTFYLNLGFAHEFIRGRAGEQARRRPAKGPERRRQTASERRNQRLMQRMYGAWM